MKRIVIMGATSGIGYCVAQEFVKAGWMVGVAGRNTQVLATQMSENPERVKSIRLDVTKPDAEERLLQLIEKIGGMDVFLLSSGVGKQNTLLDEDIEKKTVMTNVFGFTQMVDAAYRYFRENNPNGRIAAITSVASVKGLGVAASYSASKRYQVNYLEAVEQLARMEGLGIRVLDIRPGFVNTPLLKDGKQYPMLLAPEQVARTICRSVEADKRVVVINWKYKILCALWRLVPRCIWVRMKIRT